ncbi:SidA/IucD/PvdA family monooxygenase [Micromonospora sp. BRA006-A]|nr:SidA/IucD/PvdA family monooxygenase [Micromonospora sp. BRA006-A]
MPDEPDLPWIVIGSGQTSAECVAALLARGCRDIRWIGRRSWFAPLEDSPSANDLYRPAYQEAFLTLSRDVRERLVSGQILTSDGISPGTLRGVYQHNYEERLLHRPVPGDDHAEPYRHRRPAARREVELECLTAGSGEERHRAVNLVVAAGRRQAPLPFDPERPR